MTVNCRAPASAMLRGGCILLATTNAKLISADTGAFVQFEKPDIVIDAIRDVYDQARSAIKR